MGGIKSELSSPDMRQGATNAADLVLAALRGDVAALRAALSAGADLEAVVDFALRQEIVPALADRLAPVEDLLPEGLLAAMADYCDRTAAHNQTILQAARMARDALAQEDIPVIFAKGLFFGELIQPGDRRRLAKDVDLYVRKEDARRSHGLLRAAGFDEDIYPFHETFANNHHCAMYSGDLDALLELHWDIAPPRERVHLDVPRLISRGRTITLDGTDFRVPRPGDGLLFLALELEKDGWTSLKKLMDFAGLVSVVTPDDAADAITEAEACGKRRVLAITLAVAARLGLAQPAGVLDDLARRDPTANRIACEVVGAFRHSEKSALRLVGRHLLLAQKHERLSRRITHLLTVSLQHGVSRWRRLRRA